MFTTRAAKQLRSPILRQLGRRQLHGAGQSGFQGAADNAFNRERAAVKDHAAATSGMFRACRFLARVNWPRIPADPIHNRPLAQALHLVCIFRIPASCHALAERIKKERPFHYDHRKRQRNRVLTECFSQQRRYPLHHPRWCQRLPPVARALGAQVPRAPEV